jgi:hypothetical protein
MECHLIREKQSENVTRLKHFLGEDSAILKSEVKISKFKDFFHSIVNILA